MNRVHLLSCVFCLLIVTTLNAEEGLPPAPPPYYRLDYEGSKEPGDLVYGVSYTAWIPPGVTRLRGIIVHQHGCGEGACTAGQTAAFDLHWQALATKHQCALLGPSYRQPEKSPCELWCDPRNGSEKQFLQALTDLAKQSGHPEMAKVPWALWGHSGGAKWVGIMLMRHPERVAAVWLRSGCPSLGLGKDSPLPLLETPDAAYAVPVMCNLGIKEKTDRFAKLWESTFAFFQDFRAKGGLIGFAPDPNSSHDCGNSRYLAIPWMDACLTARLPDRTGDGLKAMPTNGTWLAPLLGNAPVPAEKFAGDAKAAVWLPNAGVAKSWSEYVKDGNVTDPTPPPAPTGVGIAANGDLTWDATADLESGLAGFVIERDGVEVARVSPKPAGTVGRQTFQRNGFSDTPSQPLVKMRFMESAETPAGHHAYRVIAVNGVGLKSEASKEAAPH